MSPFPSPDPSSTTSPLPMACRGLRKHYASGDRSELKVLRGVDLEIHPGEVVAITGASGVGKSTLLHLLGALDRPTEGEVRIGGRSLQDMEGPEMAEIRNRHIGFVFQFHHLLREFSALENVAMPLRVAGMEAPEARDRARELLDSVGLSRRTDHLPNQLSGGEQQRVAVARALANRPLVLLADEPSGNLDGPTSRELHDLLFRLREEQGTSMILVTHNMELAAMTDRVMIMADGVLRARKEGAGPGLPEGHAPG